MLGCMWANIVISVSLLVSVTVPGEVLNSICTKITVARQHDTTKIMVARQHESASGNSHSWYIDQP